MKHIIRITTGNRMGAASGNFIIDLVYYKSRPDDAEPFYYDAIQTLDMVEIELEQGVTTMMGLIDKVEKGTSIGPNSVQRHVRIIGRSLGSIWEFDLVKFFTNAMGLSDELARRNLLLQTVAYPASFVGKAPYEALLNIHLQLSAIKIELQGGKTIENFINIGSELFSRVGEKIFNQQLSPYQGSIWNYFSQYVQAPFNELWTDSKDGLLYLRCRPTPFSHRTYDPEKARNRGGEDRAYSWGDLTNWIDGEPFHEIHPSDIKEEQISRQHGSGFSVFVVLPADRFTGADSEYAVFRPLVDSALVKELGTRDFQIRLNYIPLTEDGEKIGGSDGTLKRYEYYRNKLYLWNRDNRQMQAGTMLIKGNPNIRVGDKVLRPDLDTDFYVMGVDNNWVFGQPFTTRLTMERGLKSSERNDLYKKGMDFLKGIKSAT